MRVKMIQRNNDLKITVGKFLEKVEDIDDWLMEYEQAMLGKVAELKGSIETIPKKFR